MSDKPKIYANCPAGCLWETVHKSDFERSAAFIKQYPNENGEYTLEQGKTYIVKRAPNASQMGYYKINPVASDDFYNPLPEDTLAISYPDSYSEYDSQYKFRLLYVNWNWGGKWYDVTGCYEINGNKLYPNFEYYIDTDIENILHSVVVTGATEVLLVNEHAEVRAKDAYEVAVDEGFEGTRAEWLEYLRQGPKGDTPVKGIDYFTEDDINEVVARTEARDIEFMSTELAKRGQLKPEFANDISECTDTAKLYVLPDGYIYAYIYSFADAYRDLAIDNSADWLINTRFNSSWVETSASGVDVTNFIPVTYNTILHIKGFDIFSDINGANYGRIYFYDGTKTKIYFQTPHAIRDLKPEFFTTASYDDTVTIIDLAALMDYYENLRSGVAYIRLGGIPTANDVIVTDNQDIVAGSKEYAWTNTGMAFVPTDYEERINDLEKEARWQKESIEANSATIKELETKCENIGTATIPEYWKNAVNSAIGTIKEKQNTGGKDIVNFVWFSDFHYSGSTDYIGNIGNLCSYIMNACDIPLALMNGDTLTQASLANETIVLNALDGAMKLYETIGTDRLMLVRGNHDDVYGSYNNGSETIYYVNKVAPAKVWNKLHRPQAKDFRRVFGGDGTYFYLDNIPQKVRFICLNSHFYNGEAITSGTTKFMTTGFGAAQLEWLENIALAVEDGWSVVIATHCPINSTSYLSQYSDGEAFCDIVNASTADIVAIFSGHAHVDGIYTGNIVRCPNMIITCATNTPYDGTATERVNGTDKETAIDIVSIDKENRKIYCTRLGAGTDREISY